MLDGKAGADTMIGGAGNDTYVVDNTGDTTIESPGQGTDLVRASVTYTLGADIENLTLTGSSGIGGTGNELGNVILGNGGANKLNGREGADSLAGAGGIDTLLGGEGNDSLAGGAGNDVLWGEGGADRFVFDTAIGSSNVDKVMDFNHAEGDVIALSSAIFAGLGATVDANEIRVGAGATAAQTATQHLIYNTTTGKIGRAHV